MINLFQRNFDSESEIFAPVLDPDGDTSADVACSLSTDEVEAIVAQTRAAAFADGKAAGQAEARAQEQATREAATSSALSEIQDILATLALQDNTRRREIEAEIAGLILGIGERLVPDLLEAHAADLVLGRIHAGLRMATGSPRILIRVSPDIEHPVRAGLPDIGAKGDDTLCLEVIADPTMAIGAARVDWHNGFMAYDLGRAGDEVLEILRQSIVKLNKQLGKV